MSIGGGLNNLFDLTPGPILWLFIAAAIVGTFVVSSISGVTKGIRILSDINTKIFFGILAFLVIVGPTAYCIGLGVQGVGDLFNNFFQKFSLYRYCRGRYLATVVDMFLLGSRHSMDTSYCCISWSDFCWLPSQGFYADVFHFTVNF